MVWMAECWTLGTARLCSKRPIVSSIGTTRRQRANRVVVVVVIVVDLAF